jgi:quercetin dioxygenase-like cupin family protein
LFRFDAATGRPIDLFDSRALTQVWLARIPPGHEIRISALYLGPDGEVGYHQAATPQLFAVVQGGGWVRGEPPYRSTIAAGQVAFWAPGEWHAAGTEAGLAAIVIEGDGLDPAASLSPLGVTPA